MPVYLIIKKYLLWGRETFLTEQVIYCNLAVLIMMVLHWVGVILLCAAVVKPLKKTWSHRFPLFVFIELQAVFMVPGSISQVF